MKTRTLRCTLLLTFLFALLTGCSNAESDETLLDACSKLLDEDTCQSCCERNAFSDGEVREGTCYCSE